MELPYNEATISQLYTMEQQIKTPLSVRTRLSLLELLVIEVT